MSTLKITCRRGLLLSHTLSSMVTVHSGVFSTYMFMHETRHASPVHPQCDQKRSTFEDPKL